jgi:hypothetical protein
VFVLRKHSSLTRGAAYQDTHQVLDAIELYGKVKRIKEWNEGYEYLEAIPHSFIIEYVDDREPWLMFADSEEEKVC